MLYLIYPIQPPHLITELFLHNGVIVQNRMNAAITEHYAGKPRYLPSSFLKVIFPQGMNLEVEESMVSL